MKKLLSFMIVAVFSVCLLVGCGGLSDGGDRNESKGNLGDCNVVIESIRFAEDYEGKPIVIVKYQFTNYAEDAASFLISVNDTVYQNGVGLNDCIFVAESANFSSDNMSKKIKTGSTIVVEEAYVLNDTTTPIEVEVEESFAFGEAKKVTKVFEING